MSLQYSFNLAMVAQQGDITNSTDVSHLAFQIVSNSSLIYSELEKQLRSGVYLDIQCCQDSGNLELQYCQLESLDDCKSICISSKYVDMLVDCFRINYGLEEIAINKLDAIPFAKLIIKICKRIEQEVCLPTNFTEAWVFMIFYALQAIAKMKYSTQLEATQLILVNTYERTTSTEFKMKEA